MRSRFLFLLSAALLVCIALAAGYLFRQARSAGPQAAAQTPTTPVDSGLPLSSAAPSKPVAGAGKRPGSSLADALETMLKMLREGRATGRDLDALRARLLGTPPAQAIAAIREFLRAGQDASTGQDFTLAAGGGTLVGTPTLRVFLLDVLGQIARAIRSDAAAQVSREVLASKDSADEWALALRNLAWTEPGAHSFVSDKVREMLAYQPWREAPSAGLLEALDVIVFNRDATLIPDLADARGANGDLAHAADIAMDRLAEATPLAVMTYLNTHPSTFNDRPMVRADYFAKADLGDPAQRAQVETYLGRPDVPEPEKAKLLKELASPASFVADTLTAAPAPADDGAARRTALGQVSTDWLNRGQFPNLRGTLLEIQGRLGMVRP